jgi:PAS domain S-box-containing protein
MSAKRILIVEDDAIISWHMEKSLRELGYEVVGVVDKGETALEIVEADPPDLIVMDIRLKGEMDGIEAALILHDRFGLPVVYLTAYTDPVTIERAKQTEPYGYLRKPFDEHALPATIEMALHKHQLERQVKESEQRLRRLTSASSSYIMEIDTKGVVRFANKAYLGAHMPDEMVGTPLVSWYPESLRPRIHSMIEKVLSNGAAETIEYGIPYATGELHSYLMQLSPVRTEKGIEILVLTATDITEQEQSEMALAEERNRLARRLEERTVDLNITKSQLTRAVRIKDEFLSSISHELRAPLTGILGMAEALQKEIYGALDERQAGAVGRIEEGGRHLLSLINDISDLAKIEAGRLELDFRPLRFQAVLDASLRLVQPVPHGITIEITNSLSAEANRIRGDERRLKQIFVNLLGNAIRLTPHHGKVKLDCELEPDRSVIRISILSDGVSLADDDVIDLFEPFNQPEKRLSRPNPTAGLGLSLALRLVELHGGGIYVDNDTDGLRFTVLLPWEPVSETAFNQAYNPNGPVWKVLVVEDPRTSSGHLVRYLRENNAEVIQWDLSRNPVDQAVDILPDVIFLDLLLPGGSGWDRLQQLKTNDQTRLIPVVIASVIDEHARAISMGAAGYLVQPFTGEKVGEMLRRVTRGRENRPETSGARPASLEGLRVLIAEDNDLILNTHSDYLLSLGCQVIQARNGHEAIELTREHCPDVILMDIQMPVMSGLDAILRIRAESPNDSVPIIAVTALALAGGRERCLEAGATEYLSKPVGLDQLGAVVAAVRKHH